MVALRKESRTRRMTRKSMTRRMQMMPIERVQWTSELL